MNDLLVKFVLFTVVLLGLFNLANSYFNTFRAFLICSVLVICIALGYVGLQEGLTYNSNFKTLTLNGQMKVLPVGTNGGDFTYTKLVMDGNSNGTVSI